MGKLKRTAYQQVKRTVTIKTAEGDTLSAVFYPGRVDKTTFNKETENEMFLLCVLDSWDYCDEAASGEEVSIPINRAELDALPTELKSKLIGAIIESLNPPKAG